MVLDSLGASSPLRDTTLEEGEAQYRKLGIFDIAEYEAGKSFECALTGIK